MKALTLAGGALFVAALGVRAQLPQSPPPFRAGVEIVDVDVSVLDKQRMPVTGLTAADFTVLEDGRPRPIVAFTPVELPPRELAPAPWMAEVAPDAQTNDLQREGRLVVVLFDRTIALADVRTARDIAEAAIDQLRPADLAAVVYAEYGVPQNFTTDRRRLLAAVRQPAVGLPQGDTGQSAPCFCGTCTLERVAEVAEAVRDVRQRRKVLFIIGSRIAVTSRGGCAGAIDAVRARALRAIAAANLTVYQFDPSGIPTLMANAASRTPATGAGLANLQRIGNLQLLPGETGGRAVFGNQPARTLPEIFRESNSYYVLGFTPAHADGRFHNISVKVRGSGLIVQARHGYYAAGARPRVPDKAPPGLSAKLFAAISGLWPKAELPLTLTATPVAMPGLRTGSAVLMLGVPREGAYRLLAGAFDRQGKGLAFHEGALTPGSATALELKPGRYEIRAAVEEAASGDIGSVYTSVDIPNYLDEFVSLSGIFLHVSPFTPRSGPDAVSFRLPIAPLLRRMFSRGERVSAWVEMYQGIRRPAMPGYVLAEIRNDRDVRVFHQETRILTSDVGANRAISINLDLPMDVLTPGAYLLGIDVRQGNSTARRDLRFSIR